jgi:hypothetical protein
LSRHTRQPNLAIEWDSRPGGEKFLFRVRKRGRIRGTVFINVRKLMAFTAQSAGRRCQDANEWEAHDLNASMVLIVRGTQKEDACGSCR